MIIKKTRNMNKICKIIVSFMVAAIMAFGNLGIMLPEVQAAPNQQIAVFIDGQRVNFQDQEPVIVNERTLVPVRGAFEHMGFEVDWISETRTATLINSEFTVLIPADGVTFSVNGTTFTPDVPQQMVNERMMLPLRAVAEAVGGTATWDSTTRTANISTQGQVQEASPELPPTPAVTRYTPFLYTQSDITIPNRRLTAAERQAWIDEYNSNGGASAFELEVVRLVNVERANHGLNLVEICYTLMLAARFYAQTMANLGTSLSHQEGPYGGSFGTADAFGDRIVSVRAANGTAGRWTPEAAIEGWMNSPGHRANILAPDVTRMGTGFYLGGQWGIFGYQLFGGGAATPVPNN